MSKASFFTRYSLLITLDSYQGFSIIATIERAKRLISSCSAVVSDWPTSGMKVAIVWMMTGFATAGGPPGRGGSGIGSVFVIGGGCDRPSPFLPGRRSRQMTSTVMFVSAWRISPRLLITVTALVRETILPVNSVSAQLASETTFHVGHF